MDEYAHPETLVTTDWVLANAGKPGTAVVEVDVDTKAYEEGHVPGAIAWNWSTQLCDTVRRDIIPKEKLEKLLGDSGVTPETTIVLYGDNNNWFVPVPVPDSTLRAGARGRQLRPLPPPAPRRAEDGVDDRHVLHGVLERHGSRFAFADGP